jgi:class 3 adenylate cyclase
MTCRGCGTENRPGRKFCVQCGGSLESACPTCGSAIEPGDRFCGECGGTIVAGGAPGRAASSAALPHISERRLVSVLFADLVGFTTLSEHRDPEEVRDLLSRYFDRCRTLIERYGGTVEKFIGDAVMAVWGTPVAHEDDAERAVRAGLALTQAVTALGQEVGMPGLRVRAGVLTGRAAVELGDESEGMVLGDTVNTASRLQSIANPGTVMVDDVTRRASEAAIAFEDAGLHQVKGREQPVHAWTALRVVAGAGGARRGAGLEALFVERDRELEVVIESSEASAANARAGLVTVIGEAGFGKSRLLWEFFKYIAGIGPTRWWHQGRCLSYGEGVGYWAVAEMVRARAGILEEEDPASARAKLHAVVEKHVPDERERRLIEPRLAHLLGLEQRTATEAADLFSGWRLFFERMAQTNPVILAFEDLQWADLLEWSAEFPISGLLEFIDYFFILALGRGEVEPRRADWGTVVRLGPLRSTAMRTLLDSVVPGLPEELISRILERAEGVPLYAVETVRMLLDRGILTQDGQRYLVSGPIADLEVPETLQRLSRRDSTTWTRPSASCCRMRRFSGCPSRRRLWKPSAVGRGTRSVAHSTRWSPSRCLDATTTHDWRSRGNTTFSRGSCGRSPWTRSRAGTARPGTSPRPSTFARSGARRPKSPRCWRAITSMQSTQTRMRLTRTRSARPRVRHLPPLGIEPSHWHSASRRDASSSRPQRSPTTTWSARGCSRTRELPRPAQPIATPRTSFWVTRLPFLTTEDATKMPPAPGRFWRTC